MSTELNENDIAAIAVLLSAERLAAFSALTGSTREAIELHQQTLVVGASLMAVIAVVEIAVRNAVYERLSQHFKVAKWLLQPPKPFKWRDVQRDSVNGALQSARRAEYAKLDQAGKHTLDKLAFPSGRPASVSHLDRAKACQSKIKVSDGKVIAELTMHFWKTLFSVHYEEPLWKPALKRVFPNKSLRRADITQQLERIYQTRNRLAHHEPVHGKRMSETLTAIDFIVQNLGSQMPSVDTPLARLLAESIRQVREQSNVLNSHLDSFRNAT